VWGLGQSGAALGSVGSVEIFAAPGVAFRALRSWSLGSFWKYRNFKQDRKTLSRQARQGRKEDKKIRIFSEGPGRAETVMKKSVIILNSKIPRVNRETMMSRMHIVDINWEIYFQ
jgi:hypothetical protein